MNRNNAFFRVDEISEPLNAIMMTKEFLERSGQDIYYLKWAILAAHNALQGFMVLALKYTNNLQIIKWKEEYTGKSAYEVLFDSKQKLCCFTEIFKRIKSNKYMQNTVFKDESGEISYSIKELNRIRDQFLHYLPLQWSIETQFVVNILTETMKVISFLTINCIEVQRHYEEHQLDIISEAIESCNSILLSYGGLNNEA
jgi:adenylate cyclase class IV